MQTESLVLMIFAWVVALGMVGFCFYELYTHPQASSYGKDDSND